MSSRLGEALRQSAIAASHRRAVLCVVAGQHALPIGAEGDAHDRVFMAGEALQPTPLAASHRRAVRSPGYGQHAAIGAEGALYDRVFMAGEAVVRRRSAIPQARRCGRHLPVNTALPSGLKATLVIKFHSR